jgi:transposase
MVGMAAKKQDARKLDHKTLEEIRLRAVQQVQAGQSPEVVVKALGFSRACIYQWLAWYREGGWEALRQTHHGPASPADRPADSMDL